MLQTPVRMHMLTGCCNTVVLQGRVSGNILEPSGLMA